LDYLAAKVEIIQKILLTSKRVKGKIDLEKLTWNPEWRQVESLVIRSLVILPPGRSILKTPYRKIASSLFISREGSTRNIPLP
jgi:hypothetical protein